MRALVLVAAVALAGCGGSDTPSTPTGLVLTLHYNRYNVDHVDLSGATTATSRKFGPYTVDESDLPHEGTVGLVFDGSDAGTVMVCGDSEDGNGHTLQEGCDTFDIVAGQVTQGSLTLTN